MELYQLRSFVTVAETGNLTRAAERLFTSQPALSAQIKTLEDECGMALFERTGKGMVLTGEGRVLLDKAKAILSGAREFALSAEALKHEIGGRVRLGLNNSADLLRLDAILERLTKRHPKLQFDLVRGASGDILQGIADRELDAGFFEGDCEYSGMAYLPLGELEICLVGAKSWEKDLAGADWESVARMPWVFVSPACSYYRLMARLAERAGVALTTKFQVDHDGTAVELAASGMALTLTSQRQLDLSGLRSRLYVWPRFREAVPLSFGYLKARATDVVIHAVASEVGAVWNGTRAPDVSRPAAA